MIIAKVPFHPCTYLTSVTVSHQVAPVECVLYFEVEDDTMKSRLLKRAETSGRVDDNEETIAKRLKTFHEHTEPVIGYYTTENKVCKVCDN